MKIKPIRDQVLIQRENKPEKIGLIFTPETTAKQSQVGLVIAVGTSVLHVDVDKRVLFKQYAGQAVNLENDKLLLMGEEEILAILE